MPAYLLLDIDIHNQDAYDLYKREVPPFVAKHGGEYLARGGEHEVIEGDWNPVRLVLFRFPDRQSIRNLFSDPDYQRLKAIRHAAASSNLVAFDGLS